MKMHSDDKRVHDKELYYAGTHRVLDYLNKNKELADQWIKDYNVETCFTIPAIIYQKMDRPDWVIDGRWFVDCVEDAFDLYQGIDEE